MNSYEVLGVPYNATDDQVKEAYRKKAIENNPDNFNDPAEKRIAQQKMQELDAAFDEIMIYLRTGNRQVQGGDNFYGNIRQLIQNGDYDTAIQLLNNNPYTNEAQWQFLMGSALYYKGMLNQAYPYFQTAVNMDPGNQEYSAAFNRLNQSRNGNMYGSPYNRDVVYSRGCGCCDPCSLCQCLLCADCCSNCMCGG